MAKNNTKAPKPIYKRVWFWILVVVFFFGVFGSSGTDKEKKPTEYTAVTAEEMYDELSDNAARAEEKYDGAYVAVTGRLSNIDSDGAYISIAPESYPLDSIMCYITDDEQLEKVKSLSKGDTVTVKGKIKNVGEVMGYSMNIDSIE